MRTIERSTAFKRDYKRELKGRHGATVDSDMMSIILKLADDKSLESRYRDHELGGTWTGYRDCHVRPDLVLIYRKHDQGILRLARLGSHSEIFG